MHLIAIKDRCYKNMYNISNKEVILNQKNKTLSLFFRDLYYKNKKEIKL